MASTDARPVPRKAVAYRVTFPILDNDGDLVTGAASLDSEISKDGGTFVDCTNEATEIATASGMYFLDLTSTEMDADTVAIIIKTTTTNAKTTPIVMYPEEAGDYRAQVTGMDANVVTASAIATAAIDADAIAADAITAAKIAAGAIDAATFAAGAIDAAAIADGAIDALTFAAGAINAAAIATDAIDADALAADALAEIKTQVVAALNTDTYAESAAVPAATSTLVDKIRWLATLARNKITQTATTQTLRNDADAANVATATVSDDGTTFTRNEWT